MALDLTASITEPLDGGSTGSLAFALGIDLDRTRGAVEIAAATLVGGLVRQASNPTGARSLTSLIDTFDTGFLEALGRRNEEGASGSLAREGERLLEAIFGVKLDATARALASATGLSSAASISLLRLLAPPAVGVLASEWRAKRLDALALRSLLLGQRRRLAPRLPAELRGPLGLDAPVLHRDRAPAPGGDRGRRWLPRLAVLAALAAGFWLGYQLFSGPALPGVGVRAPSLFERLDASAEALAAVRNVESARAAVPVIEAASRALDALGADTRVSAPERAAHVRRAESFLPTLERLALHASWVPGTQRVLGPSVAALEGSLEQLASGAAQPTLAAADLAAEDPGTGATTAVSADLPATR